MRADQSVNEMAQVVLWRQGRPKPSEPDNRTPQRAQPSFRPRPAASLKS